MSAACCDNHATEQEQLNTERIERDGDTRVPTSESKATVIVSNSITGSEICLGTFQGPWVTGSYFPE